MKAAVIGTGYFAQFHIAAWQARDALVCLMDRDAERVSAVAAKTGVPGTTALSELLAYQPDVIDIVAPPPAHSALIRACLAQGRTIICQKPFCTSLEEATEITHVAEAAGTTLVIHENFRFQPWYRQIKTFIQTERLGQIFQARFALRPGDGRGQDAYLARQPAFQTMPRLLIHETGVHFIDLFRWMFGEITAVYADMRRLNPVIAGEDAGLLLLDHKSGTRSCFDGNRLVDSGAEDPRRTMGILEIEGEGGSLWMTPDAQIWFRPFGAADAEQIKITQPVDLTQFGGGCVAALINHVIDGGPLENTARDYLPVIRATEMAYQSARDSRKIHL